MRRLSALHLWPGQRMGWEVNDWNRKARGNLLHRFTCIEKILNYDPKANISIFSGYEEEGVEGMSQRAKDAIKDYLAKPVGLEALSALLAKMMKENEK